VSSEDPRPIEDEGVAPVDRDDRLSSDGEASPQPSRWRVRVPGTRGVFIGLAAVLAVALAATVVYLFVVLGAPDGQSPGAGQGPARIEPVLVIDGPGTGAVPRFSQPMGVSFGPDGRIYVTDTGNNRVCVFDARGVFLFEFGTFGVAKPMPGGRASWLPGRMNYPTGLDVDADGTIYVADFRNDQIQVFDSKGAFLRAFPDPQKPTGKGSSGQEGHGIAVTDVTVHGGNVYATDTYQVFVFDRSGGLLRQFGKPGRGPSDLDHPYSVAAYGDGGIVVSDSNHARVLSFDKDLGLRWTVGTIPKGMNDATSSVLSLPRGLCVTEDGRVFVADAFDFQIVEIAPNGSIAGRYGERGADPGQLNFPNDIDVSGDLMLVADKENNRVQVVRLTR
jgi:tripartite motif-containing protein 71